MSKLDKILLVIIVILAIFLGIMTYYYFYWRDAYLSSAKEMVQMVERLEKIENEENRNIENVKLEIVDGSVTKTGASIIIKDTNENPYSWHEEYKIQVKEDGSWKDVEPIEEASFRDMAYVLDENGEFEQKIDWSKIYGELPNGTYRIIKPVYNILQDIYFDTPEFEIN